MQDILFRSLCRVVMDFVQTAGSGSVCIDTDQMCRVIFSVIQFIDVKWLYTMGYTGLTEWCVGVKSEPWEMKRLEYFSSYCNMKIP